MGTQTPEEMGVVPSCDLFSFVEGACYCEDQRVSKLDELMVGDSRRYVGMGVQGWEDCVKGV